MRIGKTVGLALMTALPTVSFTQTHAPADEDLIGLWGSETVSGPAVKGELTLERHSSRWTARVGGFEVSTAITGDSIRLVLPGGQGELQAEAAHSGRVIRGFWIQPAGSRPPYASPLALERMSAGVWRGVVAPLEDRLSLYLLVSRQADGSLRGVFRNPEMNWTGGSPSFSISRSGDSINFLDPVSGERRFAQPYDPVRRRLIMDFGGPVALTRRTRDQAVGFFPRSPTSSYLYRAPDPRHDGWRVGRAAEVGVSEGRLTELVNWIVNTDPAARNAPLIHSVLVARHGRLVLDEYFFGYSAERPHDLRSASKTFTSVMAGAAILVGAPLTMNTPVMRVFGRGEKAKTEKTERTDRRERTGNDGITLGHLLTHTSGLACDDNNNESPGNENTMQQQSVQRDWYRYILNLPIVHPPGVTYAYCSGGMNLAGGVIARTTRMWLPDFFDRHLAQPLQIEHYGMNLMPTGQAYAGGGVHMRPRDLLKFGQAYLDGGVWNGRRIVSQDWVKESTAQQIRTPDGITDGYGWHRHELQAGGTRYSIYEANGNGGQFLIVIPALDLAVVFTAGNYNQYPIWRKFREELVPRYVIDAVTRR